MSSRAAKLSVVEILRLRHNTEAAPGSKIECPKCAHRTFSIKRDDSVAKCFHPLCGWALVPQSQSDGCRQRLYRELEQKWHANLLPRDQERGCEAYTYCVEDRKIDPRVVRLARMGVVGSAEEVQSTYNNAIESIDEALHQWTPADTNAKNNRNAEKARGNLEELKQSVLKERDRLTALAKFCAGWLVFVYCDENHQITSFKLRKPRAKEFRMFCSPSESIGVFGASLWPENGRKELDLTASDLLVMEGEFNYLQLQSTMVRLADRQSQPIEEWFVSAVAVGGVNSADVGVLHKLGERVIICHDNDSNGAGKQLIARAAEHGSVFFTTTPHPHKDLDEYLCSFGSEVTKAHDALRGILQQRQKHLRDIRAVARTLDEIRENEGRGADRTPVFIVHRMASQIVIEDASERGTFLYDGETSHFFESATRKTIRLTLESPELQRFLLPYGIATTDALFAPVATSMRQHCETQGTRVQPQRFAYFDAENHVLYVSRFNGSVIKITDAEITEIPNGADCVYFADDSSWTPFDFESQPPDALRSLSALLFDGIEFEGDEQQTIDQSAMLRMWMLGLFFGSILPTRPILALIAEKGSGKSMTLRMIGKTLFGPNYNVTQIGHDVRDFDALISAEHLVVLDNLDAYQPWLNDRLAMAATGGTAKRRQLYTDAAVVSMRMRAFLAITARTPKFRRDDVADRLLIFRLRRRKTFQPEDEIHRKVLSARNCLWTELIHELQQVVRALKSHPTAPEAMSLRMADFASFVTRIGQAHGEESTVAKALEALSVEQQQFSTEEDDITEEVLQWIDDPSNSDRWVTANALAGEIAKRIQDHNPSLRIPITTQMIAQRLRLLGNQAEFHVTVETQMGRANKTQYKLSYKSEHHSIDGPPPAAA